MIFEVVLVEPQTSGNIGAVARVMKNFGFSKLVLIEPQCNHLDLDARARSKHAKDILKKARVEKKKYLESYDYKIATTARLGGDCNIPRSPVKPEELSLMLSKIKGRTKVALVFGREDDGLRNDEIAACDFTVSIPTNPKYPAMNLSHSVAILLYELQKPWDVERIGEKIKPIGVKEKKILFKLIDGALDKMHFQTEQKRDTQKKLWGRIVGKALLTNREAMALMGLFRKVK